MLKHALAGAALTAAGTLVITGTAYAAGAHGLHQVAKPITAHVSDPTGDFDATKETDTTAGKVETDVTDRGYVPTAAERALDITGVDYQLRRSGPRPRLTITWHVVGPMPAIRRIDPLASSATLVDFHVNIGHSPWLITAGNLLGRGLIDLATFDAVKCAGLAWSAPAGGTTARMSVPLSCFGPTKKDPKAKPPTMVQLTASTSYGAVTVGEDASGDPVSTNVTVRDQSRPSRKLNLTPLH